MRVLILRWLVLSLALWGTASLLPGHLVEVEAVWTALLAVLVIGLLNALVKPVLFVFRLVTFPINLLTLGLFGLVVSFVMNVIIFWAVGQWLPGFRVHGIAPAAAGAAILSVANILLMMLIDNRRRGRRR